MIPTANGRRTLVGALAMATAALMLTGCGQAAEPGDDDSDAGAPTSTVTATASPDESEPESETPDETTPESEEPPADTDTPSPTESEPGPTETLEPLSPLGEPDLAAKSAPGEGMDDLGISGVRLGAHPGFDRVVFDVSGTGHPGWDVDYTDEPVQQGSGHPIEFDGEAALVVSLQGLTGREDLAHVDSAGGVVNEVIPGFNHHGTVQAVIALDEEVPYSVQVLEEPTRIVIDVVGE